jgi:hypothetical protein
MLVSMHHRFRHVDEKRNPDAFHREEDEDEKRENLFLTRSLPTFAKGPLKSWRPQPRPNF